MLDELIVVEAGVMRYGDALALQRRLHAQVVAGGAAGATGYLVLVEHPPVLTFGKNAAKQHLLFADGIETVETDRGGEVTAHEPGQLVAYPVVPLTALGVGAKGYVKILETAVCACLRSLGIPADTDPELPGVWVGREKICAIGLRIQQRVTLHGLALNVSNDPRSPESPFSRIVPCGIQGRGVTSISRLLGRRIPAAMVQPALADALARGLGVPPAATKMWPGLQREAEPLKI